MADSLSGLDRAILGLVAERGVVGTTTVIAELRSRARSCGRIRVALYGLRQAGLLEVSCRGCRLTEAGQAWFKRAQKGA